MPGESNRSEMLFLLGALVLCLAGLFYLYVTSPTRMTIAVGPAGGPDETLFQAFATELRGQRRGVRIEIVPVAGVQEAATALERKQVDLAVVRPDVALPPNGLTVALLREAAVIGLAPQAAKIDGPDALAGKRLGVVADQEGDRAVFELILRHLDLAPPAVTLTALTREEAPDALRLRRVDAIGLVAQPGSPETVALIRRISAATGNKLALILTEGAEALAATNLKVSTATLPAGLWGGRPQLPAEEATSVGVYYRLMARQDTDRAHVAMLAENLFQMRSRLAATARTANLIQPPDTDASSTARGLPNHPGAVDYFQREQQRFIDLYGEYVYIAALFGSGFISGLAALRQRLVRRRREQIDDVLDRLLAILSEARRATTLDEVEALTMEVDDLLATAVSYARSRTTGSRTTSALVLALDGARAALADRRRQIGPDPGGHAPADTAAALEACEAARA